MTCLSGLRPAPVRLVGGVEVWSVCEHAGAARSMVHAFKFGGLAAAGDLMARLMAPLVPSGSVLVAVPRTRWRRAVYGVDTSRYLAERLGRRPGVRSVPLLAAPLVARSHTAKARSARPPPVFRLAGSVPPGAILVDDVVTTGSTLQAAAELTGIARALTFTASWQ